VISSAQVRTMLLGRRAWTMAPQRVQVCEVVSASRRLSSWHSPQTRMPASIARMDILPGQSCQIWCGDITTSQT
jgi:hypothetical protein